MSESTNSSQLGIFGEDIPHLGSQQVPDPFVDGGFVPNVAAPQAPAMQAPQAPADVPQPSAAAPTPAMPVQQASMPAQPTGAATPAPAVTPQPQPMDNPLAAAVEQAEQKQAVITADALFSKLPVFEYAGATEEIEDTAQTFEQLRVAKSSDFPELDDGKRVSWSMEYGKITRQVATPNKTVIGDLKKEIENSKEFLEALKKAKDKNPVCKVKPRISAQSKGIATYKGVFASLEEAEESDKHICILPGRDGNVYELRRTEVGRFIARADNVRELSEISAGFTPALPPVPQAMAAQIIAFFRHFVEKGRDCEVMVHVYWDKVEQRHVIRVPMQTVSKASITVTIPPEEALDHERYVHMADIHSHNTMGAFFSLCDNQDERATRIYAVIGGLDKKMCVEVNARVSVGGRFVPIDIQQLMEVPCVPAMVAPSDSMFSHIRIKQFVDTSGFSSEFPQEWIAPVNVQETNTDRIGCRPSVDYTLWDEPLWEKQEQKPQEQLYRRFFRWFRGVRS